MILLFIWLGNAVELNRQAVIISNEGANRGSASPFWVDNDVIHFIREAQVEVPILVNVAEPLYIHASISDFGYLPLELAQLKRRIKNLTAGEYLVWFDPWGGNHRFDYGAPELAAMPELERVAQLNGGVIFRTKSVDESES